MGYTAFNVDVGGFVIELDWKAQDGTAITDPYADLKLSQYGKLNAGDLTDLLDSGYEEATGTGAWHTAYRTSSDALVWDSDVANHAGTGSKNYVVLKLEASFTPTADQKAAYDGMADKSGLTEGVTVSIGTPGKVWTAATNTAATGAVPTDYAAFKTVDIDLTNVTLTENTKFTQTLGYYGVFVHGGDHGLTGSHNAEVSVTLTAQATNSAHRTA